MENLFLSIPGSEFAIILSVLAIIVFVIDLPNDNQA